MASYIDLIVKTDKNIKYYDVNDPFLYTLLHLNFFKIDTVLKFLNKNLKGWENESNVLRNAHFENRVCLIDFTTKTIYNAKIFPLNEYFLLGIKHTMRENSDFKNQIKSLFAEGHLNKIRTIKKKERIITNHKFKNFKDYEKFINKPNLKWVVVNFGEWKYKQVKTIKTIINKI